MRKLFLLTAALAATSCGGTSGKLSHEEAQSVAAQISAALAAASPQADSSSAGRLLVFDKHAHVEMACAGGGKLVVDGSVSLKCPSGLFSCTYSSSLTVDAKACTTAEGVIIDGTLTTSVSGKGFNFTLTASGTLTITRPDEEPSTCPVSVTLVAGSLLTGSVCGIRVGR
jgi:hypothetical protein